MGFSLLSNKVLIECTVDVALYSKHESRNSYWRVGVQSLFRDMHLESVMCIAGSCVR